MSHSQMCTPKHYFKQVIQALKKISPDLAVWPTQTFPHELGQAPSTFHKNSLDTGLQPRTLNLHKVLVFATFCHHLFRHGDQQWNLCKEGGLWLVLKDNQKELQADCFLHPSKPWRETNPRKRSKCKSNFKKKQKTNKPPGPVGTGKRRLRWWALASLILKQDLEDFRMKFKCLPLHLRNSSVN